MDTILSLIQDFPRGLHCCCGEPGVFPHERAEVSKTRSKRRPGFEYTFFVF